jgi:glutaredoxin
MHVKIYTKPGCPLCDEAFDMLESLQVEVEAIDIYSSQELFDRYRYEVPVIRVGNRDVLKLKFTLDQLKRALT